MELVLRMVRERMNVNNMHWREEKKEYFDHKLPRKSFGRWLLKELALQKSMKELARKQEQAKNFSREEFHHACLKEEKLMQIAINMNKLEHTRFITMVTKNLITIVHARKKFGAYLDLDNHTTIKDALMSHLKIESQKALHIIRKEYQEIAYERSEKATEIRNKFKAKDKANAKAKEEENKKSKAAGIDVDDMDSKIPENFDDEMNDKGETKEYEKGLIDLEYEKVQKEWKKMNDLIVKKREEYENQVSVPNIYKLFKATMWQTYWHTYYNGNDKSDPDYADF